MGLPKIACDIKIARNTQVAPDVYAMTLQESSLTKWATPGQFLHIRIPSGMVLLRRPFGIADTDEASGCLTFFYRVAGKGTRAMADLRNSDTVNCLGPLGHGFSLTARRPLLVGGGMGLAPLLFLAKRFHGVADILMGGRNREELFWEQFFAPYANKIFIATDDGSIGTKGFATALLPALLTAQKYDCIYTCGPEIMMHGVAEIAGQHGTPCQVSMEKRMACGLGACLSCVCDTVGKGRRKICKDGPVFDAQDVFF